MVRVCEKREEEKKRHAEKQNKETHRDSRQNESRGAHPQPAPAAPSGDNAHVFFPSYPLISHRAYTLPQTLGSKFLTLCSPAKDSLVSRPQLLMKTPHSERTLNTIPDQTYPHPKPDYNIHRFGSPRRALFLVDSSVLSTVTQLFTLVNDTDCTLAGFRSFMLAMGTRQGQPVLFSICSHASPCKH